MALTKAKYEMFRHVRARSNFLGDAKVQKIAALPLAMTWGVAALLLTMTWEIAALPLVRTWEIAALPLAMTRFRVCSCLGRCP